MGYLALPGRSSWSHNLGAMSETLSWPSILTSLLESSPLSVAEATWAMEQVVRGEATPAQLAALLIALRAKGETVDEVVGFRDAVLEHAVSLDVDSMALDIVGTGGDRFGTVNISSTASIIAAAAGTPVIKHGNRAASSSSGSSDVFAALGVDLTLSPERVAEVFRRTNIAFVFAAMFHPGFRNAVAVRRELGVPTVFNYLGPLCNPARPEASAVGVAQLDRVPLVVGVFQSRGATALVFRGDDGLDELTTTGHSHIWEVSRGSVLEHDLDPRELDLPRASIDQLLGRNAEYNANVVRAVLGGQRGPIRDIVLLNAAAGLIAYDLAREPDLVRTAILDRFRGALERAAEAVDSGAATAKLEEWARETRRVV